MPEPVTALTPAPTALVTAPTPFTTGLHIQPPTDLLAILPEGAPRDRLRCLRQRTADARALIPAFEDIRDANTSRFDAERALERLTGHRSRGGFELPDDDGRVVDQRQTLDKVTADAKRLAELREVRTAAWQAASGALQTCEVWLRAGRPGGTVFEVVETEPPKLAKGEATILDAISNRRRGVREHKAALHTIESAPYPSAHAKKRMRNMVKELAAQGAPSVSRLVELDEKIDWQTQSLRANIYNAKDSLAVFTEIHEAVPLLAWLHSDAMIKALDVLVDAESDDAAALTPEARQVRTAEAQSALLDIERAEAALVYSAQAQGLPVEHRADCSPLALLSLALVTAPRADPPGTSAQHAYDLIRR